MSDTKLGTLLEGNPSRDAVHVAIVPVTSNEVLHPGQHVGLEKGSTMVVTARTKKLLGIVDPFLTNRVMPGDRFYLMLYQQTVTGMTHVWKHPAFPDAPVPAPVDLKPTASPSELALRGFADEVGLDYEDLLQAARDYLKHGEYLCEGGRWEGQSMPPDFWDHFEEVTGQKVPAEERGHFFSCSC